MAKYYSRGARFTALALATGTLVVAGTGSANAKAIAVPDVFRGTADGVSISIKINLPAAIPTSVPVVGGIASLQQDISISHGDTAKGIAPKATSVATATLGDGTIVAVSDLLGLKVKSSLDGKKSDSNALLAQNVAGLIRVGVGQINSSVAPDSATSALTSTSSSSLASLHVGLGGLNLPVKADLADVVDTLNGTVDSAQGTVTSAVDNALNVLDQATQGATAPVVEQVNAVKAQITSLLDSLQQTLSGLSADSDLLSLSLLDSSTNVTRAGAMVTAKATSGVGGLDILNGLVHLDAVKSESISSANGQKGSAAADTLTTILGLKVADVLDLKLTSDGLEGTVLGNSLPSAAKDAVNTVIAAVNGVLNLAGVQITNAVSHSTVDPNGKSASSYTDGVSISVNPLKAAKPLVQVQLVPASTAVNAQITPQSKVPPAVITPTQTPLARTGANLPLFALGGTILVGFALVARRRRTVEA
jgi:hypothetical protein